ncbi:hypothetical protein FB451DRAFT_707416 [Mycena latifolia]|nr:hypothetical protein FB451DRAFT_707416 [Mycena latifolia]
MPPWPCSSSTRRGLDASLASAYAIAGSTTYAPARSLIPPSEPAHSNITWIPSIDIASDSAGPTLASALSAHALVAIVCAAYFVRETFEEPRWAEEVRMYTTCAVGPMFSVQALVAAGKVDRASARERGRGNYPHHASKSALNMVGKLLSLDLAPRGIAVALIHVRPPRFIIPPF